MLQQGQYTLVASWLFWQTLQFCGTNLVIPRSLDNTFYRCQQCYYKPTKSYPGWTDTSVISCGIKTLRLYPDSFSFSFNPVSNVCTPGLNAEVAQTWANRVFNMVVCDASKGLQIVTSGKSMSCLGWFRHNVTYGDAASACGSKGGYLMTVRTKDKLMMLRGLVSVRAWIGLDDTIKEGVYIWSDDNSTLTTQVKQVVFSPGEPNDNHGQEDCSAYCLSFLNDVPCWMNYTYVCEIFTLNL